MISLKKKQTAWKNFVNIRHPYFAIVPALIKTFSSDLVSLERKVAKLASEHFLCHQFVSGMQSECSCYEKVSSFFRRNSARSMF